MAETLDRLIGREGLRSDSALLRGLSRELAARERGGAERAARLEAAASGFREALATDPARQERVCIGGSGSWFARIRLGTVELQLGRAASALVQFRAALQEQAGSGEALLGEAEALLDIGQPAQALSRLEPLLRTHGKTPDGWVLASAAAGALGAAPDAAFLLDQAAGRVAAGFVAPHRAERHLALLSSATRRGSSPAASSPG
jgi:predicted Zn-dependent protease